MMTPFTEPHVIFEDADMLVIEKPSGLTVNNSDTTAKEMTLQDWINIKFSTSLKAPRDRNDEKGSSDFYLRSGIVHRLDKETSGVMLIAKTPEAFLELQRQFKERIVEKTYRALIHGKLLPPDGEISVPVGRLQYNRTRFGIVAGGRESKTSYRTISNFSIRKAQDKKFPISNVKSKQNANEILSLVELYPKTGRTHQIRVHVKYLNRPIFSDELYGGRKTARNDRKLLPRLFLHACKITFLHPTTHEKMTFESNLPPELQSFINTLEQLD